MAIEGGEVTQLPDRRKINLNDVWPFFCGESALLSVGRSMRRPPKGESPCTHHRAISALVSSPQFSP